ncbi:NAD(+) diphosphatase [Bertholletia excelsa]
MMVVVSRTGRHLQRYKKGRRLVVGCIPYRYNEEKLEVLVISAHRPGKGMLFPKGGWEADESMTQAALRETEEEAGVSGRIENKLGKWRFKSQSRGAYREGHMFPLRVQKQLELWPEKNSRQRIWMSVEDAKDACQQEWMREALDRLEQRLAVVKREQKVVAACTL